MEAKPYKPPHPWKKLSKDLIDKIVKDIEEGSTHKAAALSNHLSYQIFKIWLQQGEIDLSHDNEDSLPAYLVASLYQKKQNEIKWCRGVIKENPRGHYGAQWTLEHAYWREYGRNEQIKVMADQIDQDNLDNMENGNEEGNG